MRKPHQCVGLLLSLCMAVWGQFHGNQVPGQGEVETSGKSGDQCGRHVCITEATCKGETCECPDGMIGDGRLGCSPNNTFVASVHGDPVMETFDNARVHVPLPCRYKVTHFRSPHDNGPAGGICEIQIHAYNYFVRDGYYPMGFDAAVQIFDNSQPDAMGKISIRKFGFEKEGQWQYLEQGKNHTINPLDPWGTPENLTFLGINVRSAFDDENNFAILAVPECGFAIEFRAFVHHSQQLPGVYVEIENREGLEFLHSDEMLFSSPFTFGKSLIDRLRNHLSLTRVETILYLALKQNVPQDFGSGAVPCNVAMKEFLRICLTDRQKVFALYVCSFLFSKIDTVKCLRVDEFGESTGSTFGMCVQAVCSEHTNLCDDVKMELQMYQCAVPNPFLSLNCSDIAGEMDRVLPDEIEPLGP